MAPIPVPTRRALAASGLAALLLAACGRKAAQPAKAPAQPAAPGAAAPAPAAPPAQPGTLAWAVAGSWRDAADKAADRWRHPLQTLSFFGLAPGMTVVEMWPGAGWYTQILAPFLKATNGKLYAASFEPAPGDQAAATLAQNYQTVFSAKPDLYGQIVFERFGPSSGPLASPGSADLVLFMQTLHSWMAAGLAEKAFRDAFDALRPGGVLGIEASRAVGEGPQDPLAASGYVQERYVRRLAEEAGFRFDAASEVNADPKDARKGHAGPTVETDRMTLRFVKPAGTAPSPASVSPAG
jgi:predicted methyltransferase